MSVCRLCYVVILLCGCRPPSAAADSTRVDLVYQARVVGEAHRLRSDSLFARALPFTSFGRDRGRLEAEAHGRIGPASIRLTETISAIQGAGVSSRGLINEAYVELGRGALRATLGRKVLSADVGYSFRPLDVLQREVRLQPLAATLAGIDHVSLEHFTASRAWAIIVANPGRGRGARPQDDSSVALRYYQRAGNADVHGIARFSERAGLEIGLAAASVPHESLGIHGSLLLQHRGEYLVPLAEPSLQALLSSDGALLTQARHDALKALLGFTWTWQSGLSFLGEVGLDEAAPGAADWRRLAAHARQRNDLALQPGVPAAAVEQSLAASMRMFQAPTLSRRTALARIAWTDPRGNGWTASVDLLHALDGRGQVVTAAVGRQLDRLRFDAGLRRFAGHVDCAYGLLPERGRAFVGGSVAF